MTGQVKCQACGFVYPDVDMSGYIADGDTSGAHEPIPECPKCGGEGEIIRPGPVSDSYPGRATPRGMRAIGLRAVADALGVDLTDLALATGEAFIRMQVESPFTHGG